ncbi:MAG: LysM peptidoglycan-binding domain-containing protein [Bacteroidetes bacterium]|nr:LysM peptidoglycan-binding domain-containing protein [Bacteroidota bacterium]
MKRLLVIAGLALLAAASVRAQEVRTVEGRKYFAHTVAQGQTLFAISKHYAVPIDAITKANPGAEQGLSIGQVLLIPQSAQVKKELKTAPALRNGELVHTAAKKETLFGIAKRYGVDQQDLLLRNPDLGAGLKEGMAIVIPVAKSTAVPPSAVQPAADDRTRSHLVMPGETLYALGKQYGVTPEAIQAANGGLPEGLKVGMYVRIPEAVAATPVEEPAPVAAPAGAGYKVALLLPFSATVKDTSAHADNGRYASVTDAAVQFYAGALVAMDSLKKLGLRADVQVFDTGDNAAKWDPVLKNDALRGLDLYIGPFHRGAIEDLVRVANGAHIVCPVPQSNKVLLGNPTVSKVLSGRPDQLQQLARYVAYHHGRDNIILCRPEIASERELQDQVFRQLQEALGGQAGRVRDTVLVARPGKRDVSDVIARLSTTRPNIVVVPSEDVEFVTTLVTKLAASAAKQRITVFGLNSWMTMSNLEVSDLVKLNTHVPASSFVDYDDPAVNTFIATYRDRFQNEPGDYAFLGYDVTFYYLSALMQFGAGFPAHFADVHARPLHMAFRFFKAGPENGYRNENAVMLEYEGMGIHPAR